jgi:hypothetical protein
MTDACAAQLRWLRLWQSIGLLLCVVVVYLTLKDEPVAIGTTHGGRFDHVLAYVVLMLWHAQVYASRRSRLAWALGLVAMGIVLEFLQRLTETRTFSVLDMLANAGGVGIGWLAAPPRSPNFLRYVERRLA